MSNSSESTPELTLNERSVQVKVKKPWGIYLVAFWVYLSLSIIISPFTRTVLPTFGLNEVTLQILTHGSNLFLLYLICGVTLMQKVAIYLVIAIFSCLSLFQTYSMITFISVGHIPYNIMGFKLFLILFSSISVWYLSRPDFREKFNEYKEFKKSESIKKKQYKENQEIHKLISKKLRK